MQHFIIKIYLIKIFYIYKKRTIVVFIIKKKNFIL